MLSDSSPPTSHMGDVKLFVKKPSPMSLPAKETHASPESYYLPQCMSLSTKVWFQIEAEIAFTNEGRNRLWLSWKRPLFKKVERLLVQEGTPVTSVSVYWISVRTSDISVALEKFILVLPGLYAICWIIYITTLCFGLASTKICQYTQYVLNILCACVRVCVCKWWLNVYPVYE